MEEHLRVVAGIVCAVGAHKKIDEIDTDIAEDDWNETDDKFPKYVLYGNGGGGYCSGGYPCDGGGDDFEHYLEMLEEYCKLILAELHALFGTLDRKEKVKFCGGMLCTCRPGPARKAS
jgi:hypothetical protein